MSKSTIEIKTAFDGCAEVCEEFGIDISDRKCVYSDICEKAVKALAKLSEQTNPLDDLFADSMEKLDGLNVAESEE